VTASTELLWRELSRANLLNPAQRHRWRLVIDEVSKSVDLQGSPVVVDLGCGSGTLLARVSQVSKTARLVGLDIEPRALDLARKAVPGAEFHELDLSGGVADLGALAGQADVVLCSEVLEHLDHPDRAVRLAQSLLRPGGVFIATVPSGAMTPFDRAIGHVRHYDLPAFSSLIGDGGFDVRRLYLWGFPFHTLFRILVGMFRTIPSQWTDEHFSATTAMVFRVLDWLFYLNGKSRRWGRQVVSVAVPRRAA
jgi:SAM-dependent methyltransferase